VAKRRRAQKGGITMVAAAGIIGTYIHNMNQNFLLSEKAEVKVTKLQRAYCKLN